MLGSWVAVAGWDLREPLLRLFPRYGEGFFADRELLSTIHSFSAAESQELVVIDWEAALVQHDRWLRTAVFARVQESQAVEDVMQDVAAAAVEQRSPLTDPTKVAAWLYRLALVHSMRYRRTRARQRKLMNGYAQRITSEPRPAQEPAPIQLLLEAEREEHVRRALARLSPRDREILLLKYTERWTCEQLAEHLGIGGRAAESRLHRARARLRAELAHYDQHGK